MMFSFLKRYSDGSNSFPINWVPDTRVVKPATKDALGIRESVIYGFDKNDRLVSTITQNGILWNVSVFGSLIASFKTEIAAKNYAQEVVDARLKRSC